MNADTAVNSINLIGRKSLIIGMANDQSIAYGCAKAMHALGAEPLMSHGGTLLTTSSYGAQKVIAHYNSSDERVERLIHAGLGS